MAEAGRKRFASSCRAYLLCLLVIGAALLLLHKSLPPTRSTRQILVSQAHVEGLRQEYLIQTGAFPTPEVEQSLVEKYIDEEVLVREAMEMGMDQGDPVVRRRLIQKMGFLVEDFYEKREPSEDEVRRYFEEHRERFTEPERISLIQVFLDRARSAGSLEDRVQALHDGLSSGLDPASIGDPFILGSRFHQRSQMDVAEMFGTSFAHAVFLMPQGVWSGLVESSYGFHLVYVESKIPSRPQSLEEVRPLIVKELKAAKKEEAKRLAIRRMRDRYEIKFVGVDQVRRTAALDKGSDPRRSGP